MDAGLHGNGYDNALTGNAGDNALRGGAGDDVLDGGDGEDTAVFTGAASDYDVERDGTTVTVTDGVADRDGVDSLTNIEHLQFSDETSAVEE